MVGVTILGSGSRGNALVIHEGDAAILIDVGFSGRELQRRCHAAGIDPGAVRAVVVSHEHEDHVNGLAAVLRQLRVPLYINRLTAEAVRDRGIGLERVRLFASGSPFTVDEFGVDAFAIPHDAMDPVGFVVRVGGVKIGIATDLGHVSHLTCNRLQECDLLVVESNHDIAMLQNSTRPWTLKQRILGRHGHLSNPACMELVKRVLHPKTRHLILAHASQECNRYELVETCADQCLAAMHRQDVRRWVARQDSALPTIWLDPVGKP